MRELIGDYETVAHAEGLAAGLTAALDGLDLGAPPGRVAALPTALAPAGATLLSHGMASQERISFVRCGAAGPAPADRLTEFGFRLGAVRLGVTRRLLEWAVAHLSGRLAGGEPTIRKQLVLGVLADVQTAVEAARHCLRVSAGLPEAMVDVHDRVTVLDWEVAKLLGGSGYLTGSPARAGYVSRLTANCWIPREGV